MSALAQAFPLLVTVAVVAIVVLLVRLDRRVGRGARGPGPREPLRPEPAGLRQIPWEIESIDLQLQGSDPAARAALVRTINQVITAAGPGHGRQTLRPDATNADIEAVVADLERQLELPPLAPTPVQPRKRFR